MNEYRTASWLAFRNEVIRLDDCACTQCRKRVADGAVLHVHHKHYLPGRKPWEYPPHLCATLCSGCHAAEHGIIPPLFGWDLVGYDDLGDLEGNCEYCDTAIRYVFLIQHPKWRTLEVGTDCCDNLTCSTAASDHVESQRRHSERRKRFVGSTRWKSDPAGAHRLKQNRSLFEVVPHLGSYRLRVDWQMGKKTFDSVLEAKAAVFDLIESGALGAWREKVSRRKALDPFDILPGGARRPST